MTQDVNDYESLDVECAKSCMVILCNVNLTFGFLEYGVCGRHLRKR